MGFLLVFIGSGGGGGFELFSPGEDFAHQKISRGMVRLGTD